MIGTLFWENLFSEGTSLCWTTCMTALAFLCRGRNSLKSWSMLSFWSALSSGFSCLVWHFLLRLLHHHLFQSHSSMLEDPQQPECDSSERRRDHDSNRKTKVKTVSADSRESIRWCEGEDPRNRRWPDWRSRRNMINCIISFVIIIFPNPLINKQTKKQNKH